jgi:hypothetical protein
MAQLGAGADEPLMSETGTLLPIVAGTLIWRFTLVQLHHLDGLDKDHHGREQ